MNLLLLGHFNYVTMRADQQIWFCVHIMWFLPIFIMPWKMWKSCSVVSPVSYNLCGLVLNVAAQNNEKAEKKVMTGCFRLIFALPPTLWMHWYDESPRSPPSRQLRIPPLCLTCITAHDRLIPAGKLWTFCCWHPLKVKAQNWLWRKAEQLVRRYISVVVILILPVTLIINLYSTHLKHSFRFEGPLNFMYLCRLFVDPFLGLVIHTVVLKMLLENSLLLVCLMNM